MADSSSDRLPLCKCACFYCKTCKKVACKCETGECPEELARCFKAECICGEKCICCDEKSGMGKSCLCGDACRCCPKSKSKDCSLSDCVILCQCVCFFCKSCKKVMCKCESYKCPKEASSSIIDEMFEGQGNSACEDSCHCIESVGSCTNRIPLCNCALLYSKSSKKMICECNNSKCPDEATCCLEKADCDKSNSNWIPLCKCTCYYCKPCKKIVCKCETYTCPEELSSIDEATCGGKCMC